MKTVNYLDVTLSLKSSTYQYYYYKNIQIKYINTESIIPPTIYNQETSNLYQTPTFIVILLRRNLQGRCYPIPRDKSGHKYKLKQKANINKGKDKKYGRRNIIWLNPPYSKNVKTNIGKIFLKTYRIKNMQMPKQRHLSIRTKMLHYKYLLQS